MVEQYKMLMQLAHISNMGWHREVKPSGKKAYRKKLAHAG
jgi:hypothetical protein